VFEEACCLRASVSFSLNRLQTRLDSTLCSLSVFSLSLSIFHLSFLCFFHPSRFHSLSVVQASNGNDPWSVWNADPSGGSNNNWASNPEGTQTGKSAADPWGSVSQGHPQAYQGPGKDSISASSRGWPDVRNILGVSTIKSQSMILCHL